MHILCLFIFAALGQNAWSPDSLPSSDNKLRCIVNLNGHAIEYEPQRWATVPLITDLSVHLEENLDEAQRFIDVTNIAKQTNPDIALGRYISGSRIDQTFDRYPNPTVDPSLIPNEWLKVNSNRIDISNPQIRESYVQLLLQEIRSIPTSLIFLDNIVHPSSASEWFLWRDTVQLLRKLRYELHQSNISVIINLAVSMWAVSDQEVNWLLNSVDGVTLEIGLHPSVRISFERLTRIINIYRTLLDKQKVLVLFSTRTETDDEFLAAFCMAIRRPGDKIFVATSFWKPEPSWTSWPVEFGEALTEPVLDPETLIIERHFAKGVLRIDVKNSTVLEIPSQNGDILVYEAQTYDLYEPLILKDGDTLLCRPGGKLIWYYNQQKNAIHLANNTRLFLMGCELKIEWEGPPFNDINQHGPHILRSHGAQNVFIKGGKFTGPGDGIYLGASTTGPSADIVIEDVDCDNNRRNGMSITSCRNCFVRRSVFQNTRGASPQAGIDIEPNWANDSATNIIIEDCFAHNNGSHPFVANLFNLDSTSPPVSVQFLRCGGTKMGTYSFRVVGFPPEDDSPPFGFVDFDRFRWEYKGEN